MNKLIKTIIALPIALALALLYKSFVILVQLRLIPVLTANTLGNFVPEIWTTGIIDKLRNNLLMRNIVNTELEGEIAFGNIVKRFSFPTDITINNYVKGATIVDQDIDSSNFDMLIDQFKYFSFKVDDIDKAQSHLSIDGAYLNDADFQINKTIDDKILAHFVDVAVANTLGSAAVPIDLTASVDAAYDALVDLSEKMDDANLPEEGRWITVRPHFLKYLRKSEKLANRDTVDGDELRKTGAIDKIAGLLIFKTTNIVKQTVPVNHYNCLAGYGNKGIDFAMQIEEIEAIRLQDTFANRLRGLFVYGSKVFDGTKLALAVINDN